MPVLDEVLAANEQYAASFGSKGELALPPARQFAILTCMDARLDPAKYAGLSEGDAHVIRNAGGRASDDAIRSLVISYKLLGTREWFVIHHTNCGMEFFTDDVMRGLLESSLETAALDANGFHDVGTGPGSTEAKYIDWLTISHAHKSVAEDVDAHPEAPAGAGVDPDLRLHLRGRVGAPGRGARGDRGRSRRPGKTTGGALPAPRPVRPVETDLRRPDLGGLVADRLEAGLVRAHGGVDGARDRAADERPHDVHPEMAPAAVEHGRRDRARGVERAAAVRADRPAPRRR